MIERIQQDLVTLQEHIVLIDSIGAGAYRNIGLNRYQAFRREEWRGGAASEALERLAEDLSGHQKVDIFLDEKLVGKRMVQRSTRGGTWKLDEGSELKTFSISGTFDDWVYSISIDKSTLHDVVVCLGGPERTSAVFLALPSLTFRYYVGFTVVKEKFGTRTRFLPFVAFATSFPQLGLHGLEHNSSHRSKSAASELTSPLVAPILANEALEVPVLVNAGNVNKITLESDTKLAVVPAAEGAVDNAKDHVREGIEQITVSELEKDTEQKAVIETATPDLVLTPTENLKSDTNGPDFERMEPQYQSNMVGSAHGEATGLPLAPTQNRGDGGRDVPRNEGYHQESDEINRDPFRLLERVIVLLDDNIRSSIAASLHLHTKASEECQRSVVELGYFRKRYRSTFSKLCVESSAVDAQKDWPLDVEEKLRDGRKGVDFSAARETVFVIGSEIISSNPDQFWTLLGKFPRHAPIEFFAADAGVVSPYTNELRGIIESSFDVNIFIQLQDFQRAEVLSCFEGAGIFEIQTLSFIDREDLFRFPSEERLRSMVGLVPVQ